ncbi:MAG: hypothetical protein RTV31_06845 [Candidatus Thorarchaeota archaeon]
MNQKIRIGVVLLVATLIVMLVAGNAFAYPNLETNCSSSGCHDEVTGMSITTVSTIDVAPGEIFQVDVVATGAGSDLVLRIPTGVENNDDFTIVIPTGTDGNGRVDDNDAMDLDPADDAIHAIYNITAPSFTGTFTLAIYAAQHTPSAISSLITVNVVQESGAAIGAPTTVPEVPLANEEFNVTVTVTSEETITYVRLQYSTDNGSIWNNVTMSEISTDVYNGIIPGLDHLQPVLWRIVAADASGTETVGPTLSYVVGQIPVEPIEIPQAHYGWWLGAPALFLAYLGTALEYYDEERFTKIHGMMLGAAYILTSINVAFLVIEPAGVWSIMNPVYLFDLSNMLLFMHAWHVWLGIISMILGTLALITHLGGWKTCNLGLPAVILWTILGIMGIYLGEVFVM